MKPNSSTSSILTLPKIQINNNDVSNSGSNTITNTSNTKNNDSTNIKLKIFHSYAGYRNANLNNSSGNSDTNNSDCEPPSAQLSHKLRMDRYVSSSLSATITNANIVFETKIRIIDILQV